MICHQIEIFSHFQTGIIACMINSARPARTQHCHDNASQIVSMDMVGITVLGRQQYRCPLLQTLDRKSVVRIDSRHTQNGYLYPITDPQLLT